VSFDSPRYPIFSQTESGIRSLPNAPGRNYSDFNNLAVLHYAGAPEGNPTSDPTVNIPVSQMPLVETALHVSFSYELLLTTLTFYTRSPLFLLL
jgi:hypothetical protein